MGTDLVRVLQDLHDSFGRKFHISAERDWYFMFKQDVLVRDHTTLHEHQAQTLLHSCVMENLFYWTGFSERKLNCTWFAQIAMQLWELDGMLHGKFFQKKIFFVCFVTRGGLFGIISAFFSLHTLFHQHSSNYRAAQGLHTVARYYHLCPWHRGNVREGDRIEAFCTPETEAARYSSCKSTHRDCSNLNWPLSIWKTEE